MRLFKRTWTTTWRILLFLILWGTLYAPALLVIDIGRNCPGAHHSQVSSGTMDPTIQFSILRK
jgi:hypothetical protein